MEKIVSMREHVAQTRKTTLDAAKVTAKVITGDVVGGDVVPEEANAETKAPEQE